MKPLAPQSAFSPTMQMAELSIEKDRLRDILDSLRKGHRYYMDVMVPKLASSLEQMTAPCREHQRQMFWKFFADYKEELLTHFSYEENVVFPYIEAMLNGQPTDSYKIKEFQHNHTNIQDVLDDMMNILLKYLPGDILPKERIEISYDIMELSDDLNRHSLIEERILIPYVESLENVQP